MTKEIEEKQDGDKDDSVSCEHETTRTPLDLQHIAHTDTVFSWQLTYRTVDFTAEISTAGCVEPYYTKE